MSADIMNERLDNVENKVNAEFDRAFKKFLGFYAKPDSGFLMVLNDGETFTALSGCKILRCPNDWDTAQVEAALRGNVEPEDGIDLDDAILINPFDEVSDFAAA
jgi:hypothetical protein